MLPEGFERTLAGLISHTASGPTQSAAAQSLIAFWKGHHGQVAPCASRAFGEAGTDPMAVALAHMAQGLAAAGSAGEVLVDWEAALRLLPSSATPDHDWCLVRNLLATAALACARLDIAVASGVLEDECSSWDQHPFGLFLQATRIRVAVFAGELAVAQQLLPALRRQRADARGESLRASVECLVLGNLGQPERTANLIGALADNDDPPVDYPSRGRWLLQAFAALGSGDHTSAARLVMATGSPDLSGLCVIDRSLGFELLLTAAVEADDASAARAWLDLLEPLTTNPIARPAVYRARAKVALLAGDPLHAVEFATSAIEFARQDRRAVEQAEGQLLLARAQVALDQPAVAVRGLREFVHVADRTGHLAVRRSAQQVLRGVRRRLPPPSGGAWAALSDREKHITELILSGAEIVTISRDLCVSEATVRGHVSRILHAFGVATRIGLLAEVGPRGQCPVPPADLTPRQAQVASCVAAGMTNPQIAQQLGVGTKVIEKHVHDAMHRLGAGSRFEMARRWLLLNPSPPTMSPPAVRPPDHREA